MTFVTIRAEEEWLKIAMNVPLDNGARQTIEAEKRTRAGS